MKAIEINGEIKIFNKLPKEFKTSDGRLILGLNEKFAGDVGFKDVVTPACNYLTEELSPIKLVGDVYTYDVIDKPIKETLAELKADKIGSLKIKSGMQLSKTDWYIVRNADTGAEVPQLVKDEREAIRTNSDLKEAEINALTTKKAVVLFDINL